MDAGPDAVGGTEFGHPDEHNYAEFLRPTEVEGQQPVLHYGNRQTGNISVHNGRKNNQDRATHEKMR